MISQHPFRAISIYIAAALFLCYEMTLQVSPGVMAEDLMKSFAIGAGKLGLMASFYYYTYALMQIPAGLLHDRFGPRKLITFSALVCALGAFFFGSTMTVTNAALGRLLMGAGSAFAFIGVVVLASRWFHKRHFALLAGFGQFLAAVGALGGKLPLAYFIDHYNWRIIMLALALLGVIIAAITLVVIRDYPPETVPHHHQDDEIRLLLKLKEILTHKETYSIGAYAFFTWAPIIAMAALWGVPYLMELYATSNTQAAVAISMLWIGVAVASPFWGWLSDHIGKRVLPLQIGSSIALISSLCLIYLPSLPFPIVCAVLFCFGFAGAVQVTTFALIRENNRPSMVGAAVGLNNMAVVAGGAIFQPLIGYLLYLGWNGEYLQGLPHYTSSNYHLALTVIPISFIIALAISLFCIRETNCHFRFDKRRN